MAAARSSNGHLAERVCDLPGCCEPAKRRYCCDRHATSDRVRRHRAGAKRKATFEHEPLVLERLCAGVISSEDALLWVLFPELMRDRCFERVQVAA